MKQNQMFKEISIQRMLESKSYEMQKEILNKEINELKEKHGFALMRFASPSNLYIINQSVFKKSQEEKEMVKAFKAELGKTKHHKFVTTMHGSF